MTGEGLIDDKYFNNYTVLFFLSMKKKNFWSAVFAMGLAATLSVGFVGCSDDDEPTPEIVENPLDKEVYYIIGKVTEGEKALEGVEVSTSGQSVKSAADGTYQLAVGKTGAYGVSFAKEGYVAVSAEAVIPAGTSKQGSVALMQEMTALAVSVTVPTDKETEVYDERSKKAVLTIPAGAVEKETVVTVTEYQKGATGSAEQASLSTINCTPDGLKFQKGVEVTIKNVTSSAISFADVQHFVEKGNAWEKVGDVDFDAARNVYTCVLNGFSNHSFGPACSTKDAGSSMEELTTVTIDNLGKMNAVEQEVNGKQKIGWMIEGNLKQLLASEFPALSSADLDNLANQLNDVIASTKGAAAGVEEIPYSLGTAKVDGDLKMTIKMEAKKSLTTFSVRFNYQGGVVPFGVTVATYTGVSTTITKEGGVSHPDHSGGAIS